MCGIVTMITNTDKTMKLQETNRLKAVKEGIFVDTLRGAHSTGLFTSSEAGNAWIKQAIPGYEFLETDGVRKHLSAKKIKYLIAHNRYATAGVVNTDNAHPFSHEHITGVHNGTIYSCPIAGYSYTKSVFDTDSEHLMHGISEHGAAKVVPDIDGAFVLVWHDATDDTMHFVRNDERNFYFAYLKNQETVLGLSDKNMLQMIADRNHLEIEKIFELPVGEEYIFSSDDVFNPAIIKHEVQDSWMNANWYNTPAQNYNRNYRSRTNVQKLRPNAKKPTALDPYYIGQSIKIELWEHKTHTPNSKKGYINGFVKDTCEPIRVSKMTSVEYDVLTESTTTFYGTVIGMFRRDGERVLAIQGDTLTPVFRAGSTYLKNGREVTEKKAEEYISTGCNCCTRNIELSEFNECSFVGESILCPDCDPQWFLN